jgi:agmatinase
MNHAGLVGVPYDSAVTYRSGARTGPREIRAASDSIETYCPKLRRDLVDLRYVDFGDVDLSDGELGPRESMLRVRDFIEALPEVPLVALGGDHLIAYPFLARALERHAELRILHIDAHWDLREDWEGEPFNHASVIRRALEHAPASAEIHSWGIRSGLRSEYALVDEDARVSLLPREVDLVAERVRSWLSDGRPIYLTVDVDGFDPSVFPGTGTPEPDGLPFGAIETIFETMVETPTRGPGLIGADLVELAPSLDPSGRSNVAAARIVRGLLLCLARFRDATGTD